MAVLNVGAGIGLSGGGGTENVTLDVVTPWGIGDGGTGGGNAAVARNNLFAFAGQGNGDLYYRSSETTLARLPIGISGQVLRVANGLPVWGESGGGGVDYSEQEQDTGLKWVDGRAVYQKTIYRLPPIQGPYLHNVDNFGVLVSGQLFVLWPPGRWDLENFSVDSLGVSPWTTDTALANASALVITLRYTKSA